MRVNTPITNVEYDIDGSRALYSTTDLKGRITHANPYFIEVSGFSENELIGAPHNLVRHPDMPPAAFADLWRTLKAGQPWSALVKNRRKNGDHYWVKATVTAIVENGATTGYISVRTKPTRQEIEGAAGLYKAEMDKPGTLALRQGRVVKPGWRGRVRESLRLSLRQRIAVFQVLLLGASGFSCWSAWQAGAASDIGAAVAMGLSAASIIVGALFWRFLSASVIAPVTSAGRHVLGMAGGDLTATIDDGRTDEVGQLLRGIRQLQSNLRCIIGDVRENFVKMQGATQELVSGNSDLAGRTDSQAAALEETAASMEELASTVRKNAESTVHARDTANAAMATAQKGGDIMKQVVSTMSDISSSSEKIANIVGIINSIASQTNLLALNAAVEAARAGEAGRGFAVVATEVRGLAQRSAEASKEIRQLIDSSVQNIAAGATLSRDAGAVVEQIIGSVNEVTAIIGEISSASAEQSTGIDQVSDAVTQMDEVTQRNASLVDVAARATNDLGDQGGKLMRALAVFTVSGGRPDTVRGSVGAKGRDVRRTRQVAAASTNARPISGAAESSSRTPSSRPSRAPLATVVGQDWREF